MLQYLKLTRHRWVVTLAAGGVITVLALVLHSRSPEPASPPVAWTPSKVNETVVAGESVTVPVSFSSSEDLPDVNIRIVPELESLVEVVPAVIGNVDEGDTVFITLTISPPVDALPGLVEGSIHAGRGTGDKRTYSRPLPVNIEIAWKTHQQTVDVETIFSLLYPPSLTASPAYSRDNVVGFYAANAVAPAFFVEVHEIPQTMTLNEWVSSLVLEAEGEEVWELTVKGREYVARSEYFGDGIYFILYYTLLDVNTVLTIVTYSEEFAETVEFRQILGSVVAS